ncbi:hypothetical protein WOLCODRAFT_140858 [Wolfiporia cocos MD-104 SS10]|uniref:Cation efflux protein n=1 Tax=Wolfiporia cocos (strain MD-104) TaxID=742152 RepID=A0A2H3JN56_WOLCO|nr:hypothetical protein WOLCODRAFT_140858 [Wolfiporia cocos MD-104 SS10]
MSDLNGSHINGSRMHRRKSSRDGDDSAFVFPNAQTPPPEREKTSGHEGELRKDFKMNGNGHTVPSPSPSRSRVNSTPLAIHGSQGLPEQPYLDPLPQPRGLRGGIPAPRPLSLHGLSQSLPAHRHQSPGMQHSVSLPGNSVHSRTRSVSGPFSPSSPSPLSFSFPPQPQPPGKFPSSHTAPELHTKENGISASLPASSSSQSQSHPRRHSRIHSRNLSVFFPRPGTLPSSAIAEDGAQEVTFSPSPPPSGVPMPSASPRPGQRNVSDGFREGFTFGARPPSSVSHNMPPMSTSSSGGTSRRGHHHKHSLSHNFFSFLEPGAQQQTPSDQLHTLSTPIPVSPWTPMSPVPQTPDEKSAALYGEFGARSTGLTGKMRPLPRISAEAIGVAGTQFLLGVWLWITAQQVGSLSCTGLGYWVVFDAFGVAVAHVLPGYLAKPRMKAEFRRSFGNARLETVVSFAQSVYLIFASVYVCKETVEHLLLASGEGHHHHNGDEVSEFFGIDFPAMLLFATFISLLVTALGYNNHSKLVSTAGNHIPPLISLLPSRHRYFVSSYTYPRRLVNLFSNPYTLAPVTFSLILLFGPALMPIHQHRFFDLALAGLETIVTFSLAYSAAVALGAVLLQTSPARGLAGGRMEAFLRAMREIERHPQVLHLPAPHIWQLTPNLTLPQDQYNYTHAATTPLEAKVQGPAQSLVVTLELHVRGDMEDDEVLRLTKWAWERCSHALHFGSRGGDGGEAEAEVTVGVVRG